MDISGKSIDELQKMKQAIEAEMEQREENRIEEEFAKIAHLSDDDMKAVRRRIDSELSKRSDDMRNRRLHENLGTFTVSLPSRFSSSR